MDANGYVYVISFFFWQRRPNRVHCFQDFFPSILPFIRLFPSDETIQSSFNKHSSLCCTNSNSNNNFREKQKGQDTCT